MIAISKIRKGKKLYLIDDQSAVLVDKDKIEVISEGVWFEI